jgi:hypothetical protein
MDDRAILAARNNADLYESIFSAHGLTYQRLPFAFVGEDTPPPYFSNLTVLAPGHAREIRTQIGYLARKFAGRLSVKDSVCDLDILENGFRVLFGGSWIGRDAGGETMPDDWQEVGDAAKLVRWETAWKEAGSPTDQPVFEIGTLARADLHFLGREGGGTFLAACIAHESADCLGLSNVFLSRRRAGCPCQSRRRGRKPRPRSPDCRIRSRRGSRPCPAGGFFTVGELRILVADSAKF